MAAIIQRQPMPQSLKYFSSNGPPCGVIILRLDLHQRLVFLGMVVEDYHPM